VTATSSRTETSGAPWLSGIVPPLCTPLDESGEVDVASLERLIGWQIEAGVDGVFVLGSSGEAPFLRDDQRDTVVEVAVKVASGQVPVLAGAIDMTTSRVVEQARRVAERGVDAAVVTAPFYTRLATPAELGLHFRRVASAIDVPVVAYEIPIAVVTSIPPAVIGELAADGTITGVKNSSGDLTALRQTVVATRDVEGFSVLTGTEQLVDVTLFVGASGAVPGLANVDPHGFVALYRAWRAGQWDEAKRHQERLVQLLVDTVHVRRRRGDQIGLGGFKTSLMLRGIIASNAVGVPQTPLDDEEIGIVKLALERSGLM
jgi:4-hydroxy-tetrahydrodipicolinate synthase